MASHSKIALPAAAQGMGEAMRLAFDFASEGAVLARVGQRQSLQAKAKDQGDYVSEVDLAIDASAQRILSPFDLSIPVISEESAEGVEELPANCWVVDPLDASNAYLAGARLDLVSVMVALRLDGCTELSLVHFPFTGESFYAKRGGGAFKDEEKLHVPEEKTPLKASWIALNHYGNLRWETSRFCALRDALRAEGEAFLVTIDPPGSGLGLRILEGNSRLKAVVHDNNPHHRKQEIWDVLPPQLIFVEAGAVYLNSQNKNYVAEHCDLVITAESKELATEILSHLP